MLKPILVAIACYVAGDALFSRVLTPLGLDYLHAFLAMFAGMLAGGYLARRGFIPVALLINLTFSALTYVLVSRMRDVQLLELVGEQHPMISIGSFAGAALGAWIGMRLRQAKDSGTEGERYKGDATF